MQQMETITEIYNWLKCREQVTTGLDTSKIQHSHRRHSKHGERGGRRILTAKGSGHLIVSSRHDTEAT